MSDGFTPAKVGAAGDVAPPAPPAPAGDKAASPDLLHELVLMGEEIAQAVAHIATMIPSLSPLMAAANRLKARAAALRAAIEPPAPPAGPQPDHS